MLPYTCTLTPNSFHPILTLTPRATSSYPININLHPALFTDPHQIQEQTITRKEFHTNNIYTLIQQPLEGWKDLERGENDEYEILNGTAQGVVDIPLHVR